MGGAMGDDALAGNADAQPCGRTSIPVTHATTSDAERYFIGEESGGCIYVESTFSSSFSLCSDFAIS
jgi:hypothetical protein